MTLSEKTLFCERLRNSVLEISCCEKTWWPNRSCYSSQHYISCVFVIVQLWIWGFLIGSTKQDIGCNSN